MPLAVKIINPMSALLYNPQVVLWLAYNESVRKAMASQPLFVTNASEFNISNIDFSVEKDYSSSGSGVRISVEPNGGVNLSKQQTIQPPKLVYAEANSKLSEPFYATIMIKGNVEHFGTGNIQKDRYGYYDDYYSAKSNSTYRPPSMRDTSGFIGNDERNNEKVNYNKNGIYTPYSSTYKNYSGIKGTTELLGVIEVIVNYSGHECLKASPLSNMTFNLSTIGGQISKKITLINECAEPVRITGTTSTTPEVFISIPTTTLGPGQSISVPVMVSTIQEKVELPRYPIKITGITEISQMLLESNPLYTEIYVGSDFTNQYSKTIKVNVNECETENQVSVEIPKIGKNCENSYCDAQHAAEYLADKISEVISRAQSQSYSKKNMSQSFGCETRGYCTFAELGINIGKGESYIPLYLQNERVSTDAIKEKINIKTTSGFREGSLGADSFLVEPFEIGPETMRELAQSGYGARRIFIDNDLIGCGYYRIHIDGAFPVSGGEIVFTSPLIVLRTEEFNENLGIGAGLLTKECSHSITNVSNFAPIDEEYSLAQSRGSWLVSVGGDNSLSGLGKKIASQYTQSEERYGQSQGNQIILKQEALTNSLAEMCLSGGERKQIIVKVDSEIMRIDETEKEKFESQIAKMVTGALKGTIAQENCLTKGSSGYNCIKLKDTTDFGDPILEIPNKTIQMNSIKGCTTGKMNSEVPITLEFEIEEGERFVGITRVTVSELVSAKTNKTNDKNNPKKDGEIYLDVGFNGNYFQNNSAPVEIQLERSKNKDEAFVKNIKICTYSSGEEDYLAANGSEFYITGINRGTGRRTVAEDGLITINTGTLHINDLVMNSIRKQNELKQDFPYYFTIMWKDGPSTINWKKYVEGLGNMGDLDESIVRTFDRGLEITDAGRTKITNNKNDAIKYYLGACSATSLVCNATTGIWATGFGILLDCGIPATTMFKDDLYHNTFMKSFYDFMEDLPLIGGHDWFSPSDKPEYEKINWSIDPTTLSGADVQPWAMGGATGGVRAAIWNGFKYTGKYNIGVVKETTGKVGKQSAQETEKILTDLLAAGNDDLAKDAAEEYSKVFSKGTKDSLTADWDKIIKDKRSKWLGHKTKSIEEMDIKGRINDAGTKSSLFGDQIDEITTKLSTQQKAGDLLKKVGYTSSDSTQEINKILGYTDEAFDTTLDSILKDGITVSGDDISDLVINKYGTRLHSSTKASLARKIKSEIAQGIDISDPVQKVRVKEQVKKIFKEKIEGLKFTQLDDVGRESFMETLETGLKKKVAGEVSESVGKEVVEGGVGKKLLRTAKSGRFWRELGRGIICGAISNAAGMAAYNMTMKEKTKSDYEDSSIIEDFYFTKGKTYELNQIKTSSGFEPNFKEVNDIEKMINNIETDRGEWMDSELVNNLKPSERELTLYLLPVYPEKAEKEMKRNNYSKETIRRLMTVLVQQNTQLLIQRYTDTETLDGSTNNQLIVPRPELTIAIIEMSYREFEAQSENELNGKSNWLKDKLILAKETLDIDSIKTNNDLERNLTNTGNKLFPGKGETFEKKVLMWASIISQYYDTELTQAS